MATVQIKIAGVDRTSAVLFASARFQSQVNGQAGEASFRIRDLTGSLTIVPGSVLELIIDGDPVWYGFVTEAKRIYVFPAINVATFGASRFFDVTGTDLNVLFNRRIVFNQSDPENILAPIYGPNTADTVAISDLVSDWLDLSGDGIDTSTFVTGVADINQDQDARAWSGSDTWGQAMSSIALLPAAIFYLSPTKDLVYCDTDTPTAPFGLSDQPNGTTKRGYREMEILLDGSALANDVMCWGIGYGSNTPVFVRDEDAASQAEHGLWQFGQVTFGIYKQATINRVADSILNGSPDSRRGAKDDRPAVTLVTYEPGLLPAQKVNFESNVFGWDDVIPIRKMEVTFESPDNPRYALTLSHEIDTPWSFFDPWRFTLPRLPQLPPFPPFPPFPEPEIPGGCPPLCEQPTYNADDDDYHLTFPYEPGELVVTLDGDPIVVTETNPAEGIFSFETGDQSAGMVACYVVVFQFDSFNRTSLAGWDRASSGALWAETVLGVASATVNGTQGVMSANGSAAVNNGTDLPIVGAWTMTQRVELVDVPAFGDGTYNLQFFFYSGGASGTMETSARVAISQVPAVGFGAGGRLDLGINPDIDTMPYAFSVGYYYVVIDYDGIDQMRMKVWPEGDPDPGWMLTEDYAGDPLDYFEVEYASQFDPSTIKFDYIDFDYVGKPCYTDCVSEVERTVDEADTFNRSGTGNWGNSGATGNTFGGYWRPNTSSTASFTNGAQAVMTAVGGTVSQQLQDASTGSDPRPYVVDSSPAFVVSMVGLTFSGGASVPNGQFLWNFGRDLNSIFGAGFDYGLWMDVVTNAYEIRRQPTPSGSPTVIASGTWSGPDLVIRVPTNGATIEIANAVNAAPIAVVTVPGDPIYACYIRFSIFDGSLSTVLTVDSIERYAESTETVCTDVEPVPPSPGGPLFGPFCELAERIDSTHYQLTRSFTGGTTRVWVGTPGLLYLPGIARDYTANDSTGVITFADPIADGERVYVCYEAAGAIIT